MHRARGYLHGVIPLARSLEPLVRDAGAIARRHFRRVEAEFKGDGSPVSAADREVEALLVEGLRARFPDDAVLGEESGLHGPVDAPRLWLIDPIDGTAAYLAGLPTWAVSVGLVVDGAPQVGLVYLPITGEMYTADPVEGARLDGAALRTPRGAVGRRASVLWSSRPHQDLKTTWPGRVWGVHSAAVTMVYAARGGVAAGLLTTVGSYDLAGAIPVLRGAGAALVYLDTGAPVSIAAFLLEGRAPAPILCAHPDLLPDLQRHFQWVRAGETTR